MSHDEGLSGNGNGDGHGAATPGRFVVRNEFGIVAVELCGEPGRERLKISDMRTDASVELDALELESLAWAQHRDLADLLDPSKTRWQNEDQEHQG
jgi:hypothetical protein